MSTDNPKPITSDELAAIYHSSKPVQDSDLIVKLAMPAVVFIEPPCSRWLGTANGLAVPLRDDVEDYASELVVVQDALEEGRLEAAQVILEGMVPRPTARVAVLQALSAGYVPSIGADFGRRALAAITESIHRHRHEKATPRNIEVMVAHAKRLLDGACSEDEKWNLSTTESTGFMNVYVTLVEGRRNSQVQFRITYGDGSIDLGG